jgi:hypothetical protein
MKQIKANTKLIPYPTKKIAEGESSNIFFSAGDIYEITSPIMTRFPIKRIYSEFFKQFDDILMSFTPAPKADLDDKNSGQRIMLFDAEAFGFKNGAPLAANKTNPLFLLYLAFFRTRDLSNLNVDRDMLICSGNMFLKFNPNRLTPDKFNRFRNALFRIMKANLDDYTKQLPEADQAELEITAEEHQTKAIVDRSVEPFTKFSSPSVKAVVSDSVETNLKDLAKNNLARDTVIKSVQKEIVQAVSPKAVSLFDSVVGAKYEPLTMETQLPVPLEDNSPGIGKRELAPTLSPKQRQLAQALIADYQPLAVKTDEDAPEEEDPISQSEKDIEAEVADILANDKSVAEEVMDEIQDQVAPMKNLETAPVNSARDLKLREAQKKIVVQNSTIEEILARESSNVPIESSDKSAVMKTTNPNVHNVTFSNFDKTYLENLYVKDILACFDALKDKSSPLYITGVDIQDTSTTANLKETWTVSFIDANKARHTIKIDVPKFHQHRFMRIDGNKYIILKQNYYNPLVKDTPNTVVITAGRKLMVSRKATKSFAQVERIFSLVRKAGASEYFITGDCSKANARFIPRGEGCESTLEYDELSRRLFKFKAGNCEIFFNRHHIQNELMPHFKGKLKGTQFLVGYENDQPLLIDENTGKDEKGRTIVDIITANLPDEIRATFKDIKPGKQPMFAEVYICGSYLPVGVLLNIWDGIGKMLDAMGMRWEFHKDLKRIPNNDSRGWMKFADGVLEYDPEVYVQLIMNGLNKLNPSSLNFEDLETETGYAEYLKAVAGSSGSKIQLINFKEFMIDPITRDVCRDMLLPTEPDLLLIEAVKLLSDNSHISKASDKSYRVRSAEIIPAILYDQIQKQYIRYVSSGYRTKMSLPQNAIIKTMTSGAAQKMVDEYSTLNPATEVAKANTISAKGYGGTNSTGSYDDVSKRSYDPTSVGKIAMSSSPDANIGINRELVVEPTIANARGYRDQVAPEDLDSLQDVNIFSPVEMLTPGTAAGDDPIRVAMANKQSKHLVPVKAASPALVSNGYDEALQFHLSDDFVVNAEEDGEVVRVDESTGFVVVKYKSGKHHAFNVKPEMVKNSGGGFYISNTLTPTVKLGEKFKKDMVLAYHSQYFRYSNLNGLRYAIGPLVKIAFLSTYNTYEDAGLCTEKLADMIKTSVVYQEVAPLVKTTNVIDMVKVGDVVNIGDPLIRYEVTYDDTEITKFINNLSTDSAKETIIDDSRSELKAHHAGTVVKIEVTSLYEPSNLTPSLGKIVQRYFDQGNDKKKLLTEYDDSPGTLKAGYLLTDSTEPHVSRYNRIKHYKGKHVVIDFYIEHEDTAGVGDKVAIYGANKNIISEKIKRGYEPYSEHRPDEEVSVVTSPGTIARRMTPSVLPISMAMKCMVELKRKIKADIQW